MISARRRPLRTCAVSILVIARRAFTIAQDFNGPLGFIVKFAARVATLAGPLAYALQYQWVTMVILSFIDNRISALEDMVERFYPPSHTVFNKIDDLVRVIETLPGKFDIVVSKIPSSVSHVSFLDWTLVRAISLLNFLVATLSYWRMSKGTKEKEIQVDTSNKVERNNEPGFVHEADQPNEPLTPSNNNKCAGGGQIDKGNMMSPRHVGGIQGATYKEVLLQRRKNKAGVEKKEEKNINNKEEVESSSADDDESETNSKDDGLLELFESAWLMTSPGRNATRNYTPRSVSFTF